MNADSTADGGFSFIESLVALAIMSIGVAVFLSAIGGAYRTSSRTKNYASSIVMARSQLDALGKTTPLQAGMFSGFYSNHVQWRLTVVPFDESRNSKLAAYWVSLAVLDGAGRKVFTVETAKVPGSAP